MLLHWSLPHLAYLALFLYGSGRYVAVIFCGRFIFGQAEPPQLVNQTGDFQSADGTDPLRGVSPALDTHFVVPLPFGLSI